MNKPRLFALVPAGGESIRMGVNKLALPLGGKSVLRRIIDELLASTIDRVLVVLGPVSHEQMNDIPSPAVPIILPSQTSDMRATLQAGLVAIEENESPADDDGIVVALGDQPTIRRALIKRLAEAYHQDPGKMVVPSFDDRRGHPIVIPWRIIVSLRDLAADQGLNTIVRSNESSMRTVEIEDPAILEDMDLPADYYALRQRRWE